MAKNLSTQAMQLILTSLSDQGVLDHIKDKDHKTNVKRAVYKFTVTVERHSELGTNIV